MYRTIYNHRINEISTWILEKIIYLIKNNSSQKKIWIEESMRRWIFSPKNLEINDFLANDDIVFYFHLMKWKDESFEPLETLCRMFIDRNLLKASDISYLSKLKRLEILAFARKKCKLNNYNSEIFCGIKERSFQGFKSNNSLKIWDGIYQNSLESHSELITALMATKSSSLIIYPGEFRQDIEDQIAILRDNSK